VAATTPVSMPIGPTAVAANATTVLATATLNGTWTTFTLTLDTAALILAAFLYEESFDGGVTWQEIFRPDGCVGDVLALTADVTTAIWGQPRTSGMTRVSIVNTSAFATTGGSFDVA
jgi:hypothetical protein